MEKSAMGKNGVVQASVLQLRKDTRRAISFVTLPKAVDKIYSYNIN